MAKKTRREVRMAEDLGVMKKANKGERSGSYVMRIVESKGRLAFDVREYVKAENFVGYTRKGMRVHSLEELGRLEAALKVARERLEEQAKADAEAEAKEKAYKAGGGMVVQGE